MQYLLLVVLVLIIIQIVFHKHFKDWQIKRAGKQGEKTTYSSIKRLIKKHKGVIYRNVVLPLYNQTTEIDLLIISKHGIICVENKHVAGKVKGGINDPYWDQIKSSSEKKRMYNPIKQNEGHIKCLKHHLAKNQLKGIPIFNYVVFSNAKAIVEIKDSRIGDIYQFKKYLKKKYFRNHYQINTKLIINVIEKVKIK